MYTSTRRPVTTYGHRRRRARAAIADFIVQLPSSPLSDPDKDEISVSEMTRRMKKRSHQATLSAPEELHDYELSSKRSRYFMPKSSTKNDNNTSEQVLRNRISFASSSQNQSNFSFQTPAPSLTPERSMRPYSTVLSQDQLSPVPAVRTSMFRKISTRNLKENILAAGSGLDLASPFNSQPNSRTSSPSKSKVKAKPKRSRTKSRTLSVHLAETRADCSLADIAEPNRKKLKLPRHSRNPSVPSVLNPVSPHDWLAQAEAFSGASSQFYQPIKPSLPLELHPRALISPPSFLSDNPVAFSTPAAKRPVQARVSAGIHQIGRRFSVARLDLPPQNFAEKCNQLLRDTDVDMVEITTTADSAPPHRRQRKRVEVRLSGDSIFSSMLDSVSTAAATIPTRNVHLTPPNDRTTDAAPNPDSSSAKAMSLTTVFNRSAFSVLAPAFSLLPASNLIESRVTDSLVPHTDEADRTISVQSSPDSLDLFRTREDSDLVIMLSNIGLNKGDLASNEEPCNDSFQPPPINKAQERGGRGHRKRRDTIRASDFAQKEVGAVKPNPSTSKVAGGRTRSGTVTQSSYQTGTWMRIRRDGRRVKIDDGLPLSPQMDGESDDELLLVGRDVCGQS